MSANDYKQSRYANTSSNTRTGWGTEREYRPAGGGRFGSGVGMSGPKVSYCFGGAARDTQRSTQLSLEAREPHALACIFRGILRRTVSAPGASTDFSNHLCAVTSERAAPRTSWPQLAAADGSPLPCSTIPRGCIVPQQYMHCALSVSHSHVSTDRSVFMQSQHVTPTTIQTLRCLTTGCVCSVNQLGPPQHASPFRSL